MDLAKLKLHITNHAYQQHSERVGAIDYGELLNACSQLLAERDYFRTKEFIKIDGVWWVFAIDEEAETVRFITCYGRTHLDIPSALKWAKQYQDRIVLVHAE